MVSFLLPLLPEALITPAVPKPPGLPIPSTPLLEPYQIAEILEAARTRVLVALGPVAGNDIWQKVEQVRGRLKTRQGNCPGPWSRRSGEGNLFVQQSHSGAAFR